MTTTTCSIVASNTICATEGSVSADLYVFTNALILGAIAFVAITKVWK